MQPGKNALEAAAVHAEALYQQGQLAAALQVLDSLDPALAGPGYLQFNRGIILVGLRRYDEALAALQSAKAAGMAEADVDCEIGVLWQTRGALQVAKAVLEQAWHANPSHDRVRLHLGAVLLMLRDYARARDLLDGVVLKTTDAPGLPGARWLVRRHLAQWDAGGAQLEQHVRSELVQGLAPTEPFATLALADDPDLQQQAARQWFRRPQARYAERAPNPVAAGNRVRVGYFSADFHDHATMHLFAGVLEAHDRQRIEVVCYSWGPVTRDRYQMRAMAAADAFFEVHGWSDLAVADHARSLDLDIAVDLKGATHDARPGIFAARAAPVQVNYLGYPASLGLPWWDYIVADAVVLSDAQRGGYSEKVATLPHSYQPNDSKRLRPTGRLQRADVGLPECALVLACFHAHFKIGPEVFACWMSLLQQAPQAVLWLLQGQEVVMEHLRAAARAQGVDPQRIVFAAWCPQDEHLARLSLADLVLDTWPCNAHTTASDALWMGVPVLTWAGRSFSARVAASLLVAVGLDELVCRDQEHYLQMAVAWTRDAAWRARLRAHLASVHASAPLFDSPRYTRSLEAAWWAMVQRHRAGRLPADFAVRETD